MGDFNDLKIDEIRDACALKQVVKVPTRKDATLDLILTKQKQNNYQKISQVSNDFIWVLVNTF